MWGWHNSSWKRSPLTPLESCQNLHRTVTLGGHNRTLCTRLEKGRVTPQESCLWVSGSLWRRRGSAVAGCRVGSTGCGSACMGRFEGGHPYLHYLHHSLAPGKSQGTQLHPSTENWIKDLLGMAPPIRSRPSMPSVSLSHQEDSISLLSFSIRGQTE